MIDAPRKDLSLRQSHRAVHTVGAEVLNKPVLKGAILLQLSYVAERSWVALASQVRLRRGSIAKQRGEAVVDLRLE